MRGKAAVVGLGVLPSISSCTSGELDVSCGDFLDMSLQRQEELACAYTERLAEDGEGSTFSDEPEENLRDLRSHCADVANDRLSELKPIL